MRNYFTSNNQYISGWRYFLRRWLQLNLCLVFSLGFYLIRVKSYARSNSLEHSKIASWFFALKRHKCQMLLFVAMVCFCSCDRQTNNCPSFIQNVSTIDFPMDLYGINELEIVEDQLLINVSYGGGCEQHDFLVISSNTQINEEGDQIDALYLSHDANNDVCEALILEHQLCFDISNIISGDVVYFSHTDSLYQLN